MGMWMYGGGGGGGDNKRRINSLVLRSFRNLVVILSLF